MMVVNIRDHYKGDGDQSIPAASSEKSDEDPMPLTGNLVDVPPFPVDSPPDVIARKVTELAEATQTDPAMAATSALTTLAACVGGHAKIQIRNGWREPLCLSAVTIARPGERKSAVQESMTRPLHDAEAELSFAGEFAHLAKQDELDMAKKTVDQLNKDAVNAAAKAVKPDATDSDKNAAEKVAQAARKAKTAMRAIEAESTAGEIITDNIEVAADYPVGTVLCVSFDRDSESWCYDPV